jgi:hypothetical protein
LQTAVIEEHHWSHVQEQHKSSSLFLDSWNACFVLHYSDQVPLFQRQFICFCVIANMQVNLHVLLQGFIIELSTQLIVTAISILLMQSDENRNERCSIIETSKSTQHTYFITVSNLYPSRHTKPSSNKLSKRFTLIYNGLFQENQKKLWANKKLPTIYKTKTKCRETLIIQKRQRWRDTSWCLQKVQWAGLWIVGEFWIIQWVVQPLNCETYPLLNVSTLNCFKLRQLRSLQLKIHSKNNTKIPKNVLFINQN